jgi:hypothetical protein
LEPKKISSALTIGSVFHGCFDLYFQKKPQNEIVAYIDKTFADTVARSLDPSEIEKLTIDKWSVMGMWVNYPFNDMEFEKVYPEKAFRVKLDGLRGIYLRGRVDGLIVRNGKYWVREVKTTSMDRRQFQSKSSVSYQAAGYIYGIEKSENIKIEGVIYDVITRSKLRRRKDETADSFGKRIFNDYADPCNKDFYYDRFFSYRSANEIVEFEKDLVALARELRTRVREGKWYRNTDACYNWNTECPFKKICWVENPDKGLIDSLYERRKEMEDDGENEGK